MRTISIVWRLALVITVIAYRLVQFLVGSLQLWEVELVSGDHQFIRRRPRRHRFPMLAWWFCRWFARHLLCFRLCACCQLETRQGKLRARAFVVTRDSWTEDPVYEFVLQHEFGHVLTSPVTLKYGRERRNVICEILADRYAAAQLGTDQAKQALQQAIDQLQQPNWLCRQLASERRKQRVLAELRQRVRLLDEATDDNLATMRRLAAYVVSE